MQTTRRLAAYTAAVSLSIAGACASAGPASAADATGLKLTSIAFEQGTVDATSGSATVTLDWTVADGNAAATNVTGEVYFQQLSASGQSIGPEYGLSYAYQTYADVNASSGTAQSSTYSYAFAVPQYAATTSTTWAVVKVTAADDQSGSLTVGRSKLADTSATSFTANELVDTVGASYGGVSESPVGDNYLVSGTAPTYFDDADGPIALNYAVEAIDPDSGFAKGTLVLRGPGDQTIATDFAVGFDVMGSTTCGPNTSSWGSTDILCNVPVTIPRGATAGTWVVSKLKLTDTAGTETDYSKLSLAPIVLTQNAVLTATDLAISPTSVDNWINSQHVTVSFKPEGVRDGIASVTVVADKACSGTVVNNPAVAVDGSISVSVYMFPGVWNQTCPIDGIAILDGAGDLAAYGPAFNGPATGLVATQTPDTTGPVATAASLDQSTIAESALPKDVTATIAVSSLAGVQQIMAGVNGPGSSQVFANSVNLTPALADGTAKVSVYLPAGLAPGTYTVWFTLTDNGGLATHYGDSQVPGVSSQPVPGGPLQFTVTS